MHVGELRATTHWEASSVYVQQDFSLNSMVVHVKTSMSAARLKHHVATVVQILKEDMSVDVHLDTSE